jgi:hypothetical protein
MTPSRDGPRPTVSVVMTLTYHRGRLLEALDSWTVHQQ